VVTEPAFTSEGLILPKQGFIEALREYTKKTGTLLIFEETNTICMGPGGATKKWNLKPDAIVIGYIVNGGNTVAAFGYNKQFANHFSNIKQGIHLH
jgi:glutamate-1-semialdehyde 2,1-aminomutase